MKTRLSLTLLLVLLLSGCSLAGPGTQTEVSPQPNQASTTTQPGAVPTPETVVTPTPTPPPVSTPDPTPTPTVTPDPHDYTLPVPQSEPVEDTWFADAVFIGDSRTDGLRLYGGIKGTTYLCNKGLSIFDVIDDKPLIPMGGQSVGTLQALRQKQYAKVYISLGLNELGQYLNQDYADTYAAMVQAIRQLQPNADIYLQLLIPVNSQRCAETNQRYYVTNERVAVYNQIIRTVAEQEQVYLLDVGECYVDETGELPYDASNDGIHFKRTGYTQWADYLRTHTVQKEGAAS